MDTKVCFKCGKEKPVIDFYKCKQMADGYFGKCKDCYKDDVHKNYEKKASDPAYIQKERERGREKFKRLGYKNIYKCAHVEGSNTKRWLKAHGYDIGENEAHHWDYDHKNDVFILDRRTHKLVHKYLSFDNESKMFIYNNVLLDTMYKHEQALLEITSSNKKFATIYSVIENKEHGKSIHLCMYPSMQSA